MSSQCSPSRSAGPRTFSRRRVLGHIASLGASACAALTTSCVSVPSPGPAIERLARGLLGQAQQVTGAAASPRTLTWFTPIPDPTTALARATVGSAAWSTAMGWSRILGPWQASHPAIRLVHRVAAPADLTRQQIAAARSGDPGDIAYTDWGHILGEAGVLDPLEVGPLARQIVDEAFTIQSANDQVYALPVFLSCLGLYRNHARFQDAGRSIEEPLYDWSTFETTARELTDRARQRYGFDVFGDGTPLSGQMRYGPFLWSAGGDFFNEAGDEAIWNQEPGLSAIIFLARMAQNYASPDATSADDQTLAERWLSGQTAMILFGPELTVDADQRGLEYSVQSVPAYIKGQASSLVMSAGAVGIFTASRHKDWALDFIHYLASKEAQVAGLAYLRLLPANVEAGDAAPVFQHNPPMGAFLRILREDDIHPFPLARQHNAEVQKIFQVYLGIALRGLATPEAAWNRSAREATALLKAAVTPTPQSTPPASR